MHQLKTMVHQADGANKATLHLIATHQLQAIAMEVAHMAAHTVVPNRSQSTKSSPWVAVQADVSTSSIERILRRFFYLIHVTYSKLIKNYNKKNLSLESGWSSGSSGSDGWSNSGW